MNILFLITSIVFLYSLNLNMPIQSELQRFLFICLLTLLNYRSLTSIYELWRESDSNDMKGIVWPCMLSSASSLFIPCLFKLGHDVGEFNLNMPFLISLMFFSIHIFVSLFLIKSEKYLKFEIFRSSLEQPDSLVLGGQKVLFYKLFCSVVVCFSFYMVFST